MAQWIEILKPGKFTAKNGEEVTITARDIDHIVAANPAANRKSPLVFGHPEDDEPAFGWLTAVKKKAGDIAMAAFDQVPDVVKQLVDDGYFKKVSVALMPDKKTIRHVGLLGAVQPAVPGLADVKFSDGDDKPLIFEFSIGEPPDGSGDPSKPKPKEEGMPTVEELEAKLKIEKEAREAAEGEVTKLKGELETASAETEKVKTELSEGKKKQEKAAVEAEIDALVGRKIKASDKAAKLHTALSLSDEDSIELSEGSGKKSSRQHFLDELKSGPDLGLSAEFSAPVGEDGKALDLSDLTSCV